MACCGRKKPRRTKGVSGKINRSSLDKNKRPKKVTNEQQQSNTQNQQ
jgi:hypothetical protein